MEVIKRDGRRVNFNAEKIENAVLKAFKEVDGDVTQEARDIAWAIAGQIISMNKDSMMVEGIQDIVEERLMESNRKDVAKAYIIYRNDRSRTRERKSELIQKITDKLSASDVENQNANVDERSFGGRIGAASSAVTKQYALDYCMSEMARNNHLNNEIYIHDLDSYAVGSHNCLSIPFDKLLAGGFNTRQTDVRPAQSINTAFQLVAVIFQLQSLQQFGGVSATHLDHTMVPYVRKSFLKHYMVAYFKQKPEFCSVNLIDLMFDSYTDEAGINRNKLDDWIDRHKDNFFNEVHLQKDDFRFDNKDKLDPFLYQSALYDTIVETKQSVEGMYHNLK